MGLNNLDDSKEGIDKFLQRNPDTCLVAEADNRIVGVIIVGNDGRRGYIYHTAVNPQYRKQGIAKSLVETAIAALQNNGINKVALVVFDRNEIGNDFWEKMGFTVRDDLIYRNKALAEIVRIDT
jgi:ribosomal protein S18 acetylase RimI-like enzyme